jgi:hypothetical protein
MQLDMAVAIEPAGWKRGPVVSSSACSARPTRGRRSTHCHLREPLREAERHLADSRDADFPLMKTDYAQGWAKSQVVDPPPAREHAPDRPVPPPI